MISFFYSTAVVNLTQYQINLGQLSNLTIVNDSANTMTFYLNTNTAVSGILKTGESVTFLGVCGQFPIVIFITCTAASYRIWTW